MHQTRTDTLAGAALCLPDGMSATATGLLRCLGALGQEATELGLPRTATALYQALGVCLRETLGNVGAEPPDTRGDAD